MQRFAYLLKIMPYLALLATMPAQATVTWYLLARHGECAPVASLKRKLPDFGYSSDPHSIADQLRKDGYQVTLKPISVTNGTAYEMIVPEKALSLVFVDAGLCGSSFPPKD
jgi:hypothetical protein